VIERDVLQSVIGGLANRGYRVIGPTVRDGAIVYDTLAQLDDLPVGWTDRQDAGRCRIERRGDRAPFGYAVGPIPGSAFCIPNRAALAGPARGTGQAGRLDRSVRHLGLRGLRPLHRLVSGRDRYHRGKLKRFGPRLNFCVSRQRRAPMQGLNASSSISRSLPASAPNSVPRSRAAHAICVSRPGISVSRGRTDQRILFAAARLRGPGAAFACSTAAGRCDLARRRHPRRVVAGAARSLDIRCARVRARAGARGRPSLPARQMRG